MDIMSYAVHTSYTQKCYCRLIVMVNTVKSCVVKTNESLLLGFTFKANRIHWHTKMLLKFKKNVRKLTSRNWGVSIKYQLFKVGQYLGDRINCFGIASKGPWRSSKTPKINKSLSNAYLNYQGLYALRDSWVKLRHS